MNAFEIRATLSISTLFCLRLLGLFMILPIFTPYAHTLNHATPFLIGITLGIYGLTQALFQWPFGMLSDHYPRKMIILLGFLIFTLGSFIAFYAQSIYGVMLGRALQGMGAVGSTLIALLTDLTETHNRAKSMAIMGILIGLSFFISMMIGPILNQHISVHGIFLLTGCLGILAIILLFTAVPNPTQNFISRKFSLKPLFKLLDLNLGVFCLHIILTATFVVIPLWIKNYTWPLFISIILTFVLLKFIEKYYYLAIIGLILSELLLWHNHTGLTLFFLSFNLLEASLPALIAKTAPSEMKGSAIGLYSTFQFLGIFAGGLLAGFLYQYFHPATVLLSCVIIGTLWLALALIIQFSRRKLWQEV